MIENFLQFFPNPFVFFIGIQQIIASGYSLYLSDWRIAVINFCVGIANLAMSGIRS